MSEKIKHKIKIIIPVTLALIVLSVIIGINVIYPRYLINRIEKEPSWSKKVEYYQKLMQNYSARTYKTEIYETEMEDILGIVLVEECPDLESLMSRTREDADIYREFADNSLRFATTRYLHDIRHLSMDDSLKKLKKASEFLSSFDILDIWYKEFRDIAISSMTYNEPVNINVDSSDFTHRTHKYDKERKYIILYYQIYNENEITIDNKDILLIPHENIPENMSEVDIAIIVSSHIDTSYSSVQQYKMDGNIIHGYNRNTIICAYDYNSGEVIGTIGARYTSVPNSIIRKKGDYSNEIAYFPDADIKDVIKNFFK